VKRGRASSVRLEGGAPWSKRLPCGRPRSFPRLFNRPRSSQRNRAGLNHQAAQGDHAVRTSGRTQRGFPPASKPVGSAMSNRQGLANIANRPFRNRAANRADLLRHVRVTTLPAATLSGMRLSRGRLFCLDPNETVSMPRSLGTAAGTTGLCGFATGERGGRRRDRNAAARAATASSSRNATKHKNRQHQAREDSSRSTGAETMIHPGHLGACSGVTFAHPSIFTVHPFQVSDNRRPQTDSRRRRFFGSLSV
jgi:hypothetical protein